MAFGRQYNLHLVDYDAKNASNPPYENMMFKMEKNKMEARQSYTDRFIFYRVLLIILVEGFVSIGIEILTIRQLLPVAGGSVVVTSLVIGVFLLFLALGYQQGGKQKNNLQYILQRNFLISALWLGVGLSYLFIITFFYVTQKVLGLRIIYPLMAYLLIVIAPLIYLLGQTVPITMNMVKQNRPAGFIGGRLLGMSTIGSFLGAILTTLVFMYFFGVAWTIFLNFALLIMLSLFISENKLSLLFQCCLAISITSIVYICNIAIEKNAFALTNSYANYQIVTSGQNQKMLVINDAQSSFIDKDKKGLHYIESIKKILFDDLKLRHENILVLGAGGFSLSAEKTYDNQFTYVDIDKQIKKIAVPQFIHQMNGDLIIADARQYLYASKKQYQAIVIDAYSDIKYIPAHLLTREYMLLIRQHLNEKGVAIFNILANPTFPDAYSKRIDNTIRSAFSYCVTIPNSYVNRMTNILYVCGNGTRTPDKTIYSDNSNNSSTDSFFW